MDQHKDDAGLWSLARSGGPSADYAVAVQNGDTLRLHVHLRRGPAVQCI